MKRRLAAYALSLFVFFSHMQVSVIAEENTEQPNETEGTQELLTEETEENEELTEEIPKETEDSELISESEEESAIEDTEEGETEEPQIFEENVIEKREVLLAPQANESDFIYSTAADGKVTIIRYTGNETDLIIPSTLGGNPVVELGNGSFSGIVSLTSVVIPDGVTRIGHEAFYSCVGLRSIWIPDSVTSIGEQAFGYDWQLEELHIESVAGWLNTELIEGSSPLEYPAEGKIFVGDTELTVVRIPDGVTEIPERIFCGCTNITSVVFPDSVTAIRAYAFEECTGLVSAEFPNQLKTIEMRAFYECPKLTGVVFPESITEIGEEAFVGCIGLTSIRIPGSVEVVEKRSFAYCENLKSIQIAEGVREIGDSAFTFAAVKSLSLPESVKIVGDDSFSSLKELEALNLGSGVEIIGPGAFSFSEILTSVEIPANVRVLEDYSFGYCYNLKEIIFRGDGPVLNSSIFTYKMDLTAYYPQNNPTWNDKIVDAWGNPYAYYGASKLTWESYDNSDSPGIPENAIRGRAANLVLQGSIVVQFKINVPDPENTNVVITYKGKETRFPATDGEPAVHTDGSDIYIYKVPVAAKELHNKITIAFEDKDGYPLDVYKGSKIAAGGITYSVEEYVKSQQNSTIPGLKDMLDAMMVYGEWSQKLFDYYADTVDPQPVSGVTLSDLEPYQLVRTGSYPAGISVSSSSLLLRSETSVIFKLRVTQGSINDYTIKVDGKTVSAVLETDTGLWQVKKENIVAKNLDEMAELEISKSGDANVFTAMYGPLSYAYNILNSSASSEALVNTCKALYKYNEKAKVYFGKE